MPGSVRFDARKETLNHGKILTQRRKDAKTQRFDGQFRTVHQTVIGLLDGSSVFSFAAPRLCVFALNSHGLAYDLRR